MALVPTAPQPLNDCIKDGNVIDESVVRYRYGELPVAEDKPTEPQLPLLQIACEGPRTQGLREAFVS